MHPRCRILAKLSLFALLMNALPIAVTGADLPTRPPARVNSDAPPPSTQAASVNALCDPELDMTSAGGQGSRILHWPAQNDPEYPKVLQAYIKEREQSILENNSKLHKQFGNPTDATQPDLRESNKARAAFHDLIYGGASAVVVICEAKREMTKHMEAYNLALAQGGSDSVTACEGATQKMYETYGNAQKAYTHLSDIIDKRLNKGVTVNGKNIEPLESAFFKYRRINRVVNKANEAKVKAVNAEAVPALSYEMKMIWGSQTTHRGDSESAVDPNGHYSSVLLQTRQEKKVVDEKKKWFEDNKAKYLELKGKCETAGAGTNTNTNTNTSTDTNTDLIGRPGPGAGTPGPGAGSPGPGAGSTPGPGAGEGPGPGAGAGPGPGAGGDSTLPPPKKGLSSGMKTGLIVVGGAAAVGAALFAYKKYKDDKKNKEYFDNPSNYLPLNAVDTSVKTYSSGSGSSGDTAPAGSKLLILSTIGDVARGATLPAVELQLVDSANKPLPFNGLAIQASCYIPQPCSIDGAQNVTTVDGKVRFDSLKFLQAHDSVRMQFSAAGVPTVTTPNTFKVNNARMDDDGNPTSDTVTNTSTSTSTYTGYVVY